MWSTQILRISEKGEISVETQVLESDLVTSQNHGISPEKKIQRTILHMFFFSSALLTLIFSTPAEKNFAIFRLPNLRSHRSRFGQYDRSTQEVLQSATQILRAIKGAPLGDQFLQNLDFDSGLGAFDQFRWCLKIFWDTIF